MEQYLKGHLETNQPNSRDITHAKELYANPSQSVGGVIENLPVSSNQLQRIKEEQLKDDELKRVIELTLQGGPGSKYRGGNCAVPLLGC